MQLLCNGVRLDLYDNASLQFKHTNPLFAFDKLECERTTQFKLPCTHTNDGVLALARIPAYAGAGMRQKFTAQLQDGIVVKNGYLYVSDYDGKDYTAIFVTGELLGLQAVKNAGNLADFYTPTATAPYGQPAAFAGLTLFQTLNYCNVTVDGGGISRYSVEPSICRPCINLGVLAVNTLQQTLGIGLTIPYDLYEFVYLPEQYVDQNGDEINTQGTNIALRDNLPEWNGVQLAQILANLGGYLLNFENNTLTFVKNVSELQSAIDITAKLIKMQKVERTLPNYAQHNYVRWADEDEYGYPAKNKTDYAISNDNIAYERDAYTLAGQPTIEVTPYGMSIYDVALVWDKYSRSWIGNQIVPMGANFFARLKLNGTYPTYLRGYNLHGYPSANPIIQALCSLATSVQVQVRMTLGEYNDITPLGTLMVQGTRYVWLERSWQKDTATFTLARI